jgi:hypothetical protein
VRSGITNSILSQDPPCGNCDFLVEVFGKNHPNGQKPVVYQHQGEEFPGIRPREADGKHKNHRISFPNGRSTLYIWPWKNQPPSRMVLEVDSEDGQSIQLPLLEQAEQAQWQTEKGHENLLAPIVPMAWLRGMAVDGKHLTWPVLARPGYLYLFREGRLWRELKITWENDRPVFRDTRLSDYRDEDGKITADQRHPAGKPLEDIWVPVRLGGKNQSMEAAFAESPLPAARINRLEADFTLRHYRCTQLKTLMPCSQPGIGFARAESRDAHVFRMDQVEPQRPREPAREWQFEHPWHYLGDMKGNYTRNAYDMAQDLFGQWEAGERTTPLEPYERPEPAALALCLQQDLDSRQDNPPARPFDPADWGDRPGAEDILTPYRERDVCGLRIEDRLYELRHQQTRIHTARHLLMLCAERARLSPHLESALLVSQAILPYSIQGQANPLARFSQALPDKGRLRVHRLLMTEERELGQRYLKQAQDELLLCLQRQPYQQTLGDLFSASGFDYAGAFRCTGRFIADTLEPPLKADPLHPGHGLPSPDSDGKAWLRDLCEESAAASQSRREVSLARMLWPQADPEQQQAPYQPPAAPEPNNGDGVFRGTALAELEDRDLPEDLNELLTIEGFRLADDLQSGALNTLMLAGMSNGMKALDAAHRELHESIRTAQAALENNDREKLKLNEQQRELTRRRARLRAAHQADAEAWLKAQTAENNAKQNQSAKALKDFEQARERAQTKLAQARQAIHQRFMAQRLARLSNPMEAVRQSMPNLLPGLRQMPLSDAIAQGKYIPGLEDLTADGARFTPASQQEGRIPVWVLDQDKPATESIRALTRAQNNLILARRAVDQANGDEIEAQNRLAAAQSRYNQVTEELKATGSRIRDLNADIRVTESATEQHKLQLDSAENSRLYKVLNTPALPVVVLVIEGVNVWSTYSQREDVSKQRGQLRAYTGMGSSAYGAGVAAILLAERFANELVRQKLTAVLTYEFEHQAAQAIAEFFGAKAMTVKMFLGGIGGLAFAGISLSDTLYALDMGDPAAVGHGLITAGGAVTTLAALVPAQVTLLGMGPLGWVGLGLILGGVALVATLEDEPIENWLRNGPFGEEDGLPHLKGNENATEAYYRLVNLLAHMRLTKIPVPETLREWRKKQGHTDDPLTEATDIVRLESNLAGLVGAHGLTLTSELRLMQKKQKRNGRSTVTKSHKPLPDAEMESHIVYEGATPTGYEMLVKTPRNHREPARRLGVTTGHYDVSYRWQAKAQFRATLQGQELAFPAPPPKDTTRYNPDEESHTEADFEDDKQLYWINGFQ